MKNESTAYYNKYKRDKERQRFYSSSAWAKCREMALKRDNYLCQECFTNGKIKHAELVHHICEVKDDITLALTLSNLISWCNACHNKHHKSSETNRKEVLPTKVHVIKAQMNSDIF